MRDLRNFVKCAILRAQFYFFCFHTLFLVTSCLFPLAVLS